MDSVLHLSFMFTSSIFLLKDNLSLSAKNIIELSSFKIGYNIDIIKSLTQQNIDTWIGVFLLLISFFMEAYNIYAPVTIDSQKERCSHF